MKNTTEEPNENKTYWNHCFYLNNNSIQQNSNEQQITTSNFEPPWILQYYQDKGYMAISRKDFKLGDVICNEFPITYTKAWHPFNDKEKETIEQEIQSLLKGKLITYTYTELCTAYICHMTNLLIICSI